MVRIFQHTRFDLRESVETSPFDISACQHLSTCLFLFDPLVITGWSAYVSSGRPCTFLRRGYRSGRSSTPVWAATVWHVDVESGSLLQEPEDWHWCVLLPADEVKKIPLSLIELLHCN